MIGFIGEHWKYLIGAVGVHLLIAGIVALTVISTPQETVVPQLAIQAVVVDQSLLDAPARRERERKAQADAQERRREEEERQKQEAEERTQREAEQAKQLEAEREAEQLKREQQAEVERTRQAEAEREKAEADRKQRAEAERQRREQADRERVAEIERKQREAEEGRRAEADRRAQSARESELQAQLAEEEGRLQAENAGLLNQYIAMLQQRIVRNWNRPPSARPGIECKVTVNQAPGGMVLSVQIGECNGDAAVRQSIEAAVQRSSPLPPPPDRRLFERTLILWFKPID